MWCVCVCVCVCVIDTKYMQWEDAWNQGKYLLLLWMVIIIWIFSVEIKAKAPDLPLATSINFHAF